MIPCIFLCRNSCIEWDIKRKKVWVSQRTNLIHKVGFTGWNIRDIDLNGYNEYGDEVDNNDNKKKITIKMKIEMKIYNSIFYI